MSYRGRASYGRRRYMLAHALTNAIKQEEKPVVTAQGVMTLHNHVQELERLLARMSPADHAFDRIRARVEEARAERDKAAAELEASR